MQNKNKNNRKVTKLPTAKLIEIAIANCKNGHNLEILSCTKALPIFPDWKIYEIGNHLARFSYESRSYTLSISHYSQLKAKENFCDFRYEFIKKTTVKVENFRTIIMKWAKHSKF